MEENLNTIAAELAELGTAGADFGAAWGEHIKETDGVKTKAMNLTPEQKSEDPPVETPQVDNPKTKKKEEPVEDKKHEELKISDDPFEDILSDKKKEEVETSEDDPDFEKELEEKYKDEPADAKGKAKWGEIKGELKSIKQAKYQLERSLALKEKELSELRAAAQGSQSDEYKAKYEELIKSNPLIALQADEDFQQKVAIPYQEAVSSMQTVIQEFGLPADKISEAMAAPNRIERNRKLSEILNEADVDELSKADFKQALAQYETLHGAYAKAHEEAVTLYEASKQKAAESQKKIYEERKKQLLDAESDVFERLAANKQFKEIFNGTAEELRNKVKKSLETESDPRIAVLEKFSSFAFKPLMTALESKDKKIAELEQALSKYVNGGATAGAGGTPTPSKTDQSDRFKEIGQDFGAALAEVHGGARWTRSKF